MPLSSRTRNTVILLALAVIAAVALWYGVFILVKNNSQEASTIAADAEYLLKREDRDRALATLLEEIRGDQQGLTSRYVASDGTVAFIETIESLASEHKLARTVASVDIDSGTGSAKTNAEAPEGFEWLNLTLSTSGSWKNTYTFLALLESLPYKTRMDFVSLSNESGVDQWTGRYSLSVLKHK